MPTDNKPPDWEEMADLIAEPVYVESDASDADRVHALRDALNQRVTPQFWCASSYRRGMSRRPNSGEGRHPDGGDYIVVELLVVSKLVIGMEDHMQPTYREGIAVFEGDPHDAWLKAFLRAADLWGFQFVERQKREPSSEFTSEEGDELLKFLDDRR